MIKLLIIFISLSALADDIEFYKLGSTWDRKAFDHENIQKIPKIFQRQARSVGSFLGGTAFYLGKINGRHLMATNYHVLPKALNCYSLNSVNFRVMNQSFPCEKFIASFKSVDLSLFQVRVRPEQEKLLKGFAFKISKRAELTKKLYGMGYTFLNNPMREKMLVSGGRFCTTFSPKVRLIKDPDTRHPVDYKVWSQPIGCDFAHGDSGSPIINEQGELVGLFWTGGTPKSSFVKNDERLNTLINSNDPLVWSDLSYMIPLKAIRRELRRFLIQNPDHPYFLEIESLVFSR